MCICLRWQAISLAFKDQAVFPDLDFKDVELNQDKGKWVILLSYPLASCLSVQLRSSLSATLMTSSRLSTPTLHCIQTTLKSTLKSTLKVN